MTVETTCRKCGKPLRYKPKGNGRPRTVCFACQKEAVRQYRQAERRTVQKKIRLQEGEETGMDLMVAGVVKCARSEVGKAWGISEARVAQIERLALAKIREHPELRQCYARWIAEGRPTSKWGRLSRDAAGWWMLHWIAGMRRWRRAMEVMAEAPETQTEAAEMEQLVDPFQHTLAAAANQLLHPDS